MTKTELIANLIVMGFSKINKSSTGYEYRVTNEYAKVTFVHNQHVRVILDYPTFKGGQYCTYYGALLWICENAK